MTDQRITDLMTKIEGLERTERDGLRLARLWYRLSWLMLVLASVGLAVYVWLGLWLIAGVNAVAMAFWSWMIERWAKSCRQWLEFADATAALRRQVEQL